MSEHNPVKDPEVKKEEKGPQNPLKQDPDSRDPAHPHHEREKKIDETLDDSFPASDPPSHGGVG